MKTGQGEEKLSNSHKAIILSVVDVFMQNISSIINLVKEHNDINVVDVKTAVMIINYASLHPDAKGQELNQFLTTMYVDQKEAKQDELLQKVTANLPKYNARLAGEMGTAQIASEMVLDHLPMEVKHGISPETNVNDITCNCKICQGVLTMPLVSEFPDNDDPFTTSITSILAHMNAEFKT